MLTASRNIASALVISRPDEPEETRVLPSHPAKIFDSGTYPHLPLLSGTTENEAMFIVDSEYQDFRLEHRKL
jgi:hypothetical protein